MAISTKYRGHVISWSDNLDEWTCYDLSDKVYSSPKLSNIKAAIDRLYLAERKEASVPCWEISGHSAQRIESNVVEYLGEKVDRNWSTNQYEVVDHKVAVVATRKGNERPARKQTELGLLSPKTPEVEEAWAHYVKLDAEAKRASKRATEAYYAIPRMKVEDVAELVRLYKLEEEKDG